MTEPTTAPAIAPAETPLWQEPDDELEEHPLLAEDVDEVAGVEFAVLDTATFGFHQIDTPFALRPM
jgi:hypothetical protein